MVFFGSLDLIRLFHKCLFFVALGTGGFGPLAPRASGQPPLFLLCIPCIWTIEGPGLDTYPGIIFFIFVLGMNPASTCCVINILGRKTIHCVRGCLKKLAVSLMFFFSLLPILIFTKQGAYELWISHT